MDNDALQALARRVIDIELAAVEALKGRIDDAFLRACQLLLACSGRVVVTGMGKSGHIGSKIAATLASTGTPAFFVHPGEASHGDLGMITRGDVVMAISNSGETSEVITILPLIKRLGVPLISLTGKPESTMARLADAHISVAVAQEACPLNLAPTASTTATLVMGDALAVALLEARGFTEEDFARSHPGGALGRRLLLKVADFMHTGEEVPIVDAGTDLAAALLEVTAKRMGMTLVRDAQGAIAGLFTDGDLRRVLESGGDVHSLAVGEVMTRGGRRISAEALAAEAVQKMEAHAITTLLVEDETGTVQGVVHLHDLLRAGVV